MNRGVRMPRKRKMLHILLTLGVAVPAVAQPQTPRLTGVAPAIITTGSSAAPVTLLGRDLAGAEVTLRACDGSTTTVRASTAKRAVLLIPATLRRRPCILRVALGPGSIGLPVPVADPAVLTLTVPAPADPVEMPTWSGRFSTLCPSDTTEPPAAHSLLAVTGDAVTRATFVLGREDRALMRVTMVAPAVADDAGDTCRYLLLPGVDPSDVRWGPDDVEGLWVALLGTDGRALRERRFLSDMVTEPSGPLDR